MPVEAPRRPANRKAVPVSGGLAGREVLRRLAEAVRPLKRRKRASEEAVHATRVTLRRLREFLLCAAPHVPPRQAGRIDVRLRRAIRRLGAVRDADVALGLCAGGPGLPIGPAEREVLFALIPGIESERAFAQERLDRARLRLRRIRDEAREIARGWRAGEGPDAGFLAGARVAAWKALRREARVAGGVDDPLGLHAVRLRAKHLRYVLEAGAGEAPPGWVELATELQRVLGEFHDLHLLLRRIDAALGAGLPGVTRRGADPLRARIGDRLETLHSRARTVLADPRLNEGPDEGR